MDYFNTDSLGTGGTVGLILILIWSLFWKGLALWHASHREDRKWFIIILVLNTFGILELIYLFLVIKVKFNKLW